MNDLDTLRLGGGLIYVAFFYTETRLSEGENMMHLAVTELHLQQEAQDLTDSTLGNSS